MGSVAVARARGADVTRARLARATNSYVYDGFTGWASDRRALLLELWGAEVVDGPHGLCERCGDKRTAPGVCAICDAPKARGRVPT